MRIYKYAIILAISGMQIVTAEDAFEVFIFGDKSFDFKDSCEYTAVAKRLPHKVNIPTKNCKYLWFATGSNRQFFDLASSDKQTTTASLTSGKILTAATVGTIACKVTVGTISEQKTKNITITI